MLAALPKDISVADALPVARICEAAGRQHAAFTLFPCAAVALYYFMLPPVDTLTPFCRWQWLAASSQVCSIHAHFTFTNVMIVLCCTGPSRLLQFRRIISRKLLRGRILYIGVWPHSVLPNQSISSTRPELGGCKIPGLPRTRLMRNLFSKLLPIKRVGY